MVSQDPRKHSEQTSTFLHEPENHFGELGARPNVRNVVVSGQAAFTSTRHLPMLM